MNPVVQFLLNQRFSKLIIPVLCVWPWCSKAIWNSALRTAHAFLGVTVGSSSLPGRVCSKRPFRRARRLNLHHRPRLTLDHQKLGLTPKVAVPKYWKTRALRRRRSVIMGRKPQSTRMRGRRFRYLYFVPPILFAFFSSAPHCNAQQFRADNESVLSDIRTFQQVEDRWSRAITKRDQYTLELVLSPELIDISAAGDQTTRNQQIAMLFEKGSEPLSLNQCVINVRRFGGVALVIGAYVEQLRVNGKLVRQKGKFTHVYQNVHSNWLCVSAQRTTEVEPAMLKPQGVSRQSNIQPVIAIARGNAQ